MLKSRGCLNGSLFSLGCDDFPAKGRFLDSDFGFWIGRFACCPWSRVSSHSGVTKRHPPYRSGFCLYVNRNSEMDKRPPYRPGFRVYVNPESKIKMLPSTVSGYGPCRLTQMQQTKVCCPRKQKEASVADSLLIRFPATRY